MSAKFAALALARNPKVRKFARTYGKKFALSAVRGIQNRRIRRGRRQYLPRIPRQFPRNGATITRNSLAPVRVLNQRTTTTGDQTVIDTEKTLITLTSQAGDEASTLENFHLIDPTDNTYWPRLSAKSQMFTEWDINQFVLTYTPCVGTSYNGTIVMGFTPQSAYGSADFNTSTEISGMQQSVTFSAGSAAEFRVDTTKMAQAGRSLFIPSTGILPGEYTRYFGGVIAMRAFNCEDAGTVLGTLQCSYYVRLRRPRISTAPQASSIVFNPYVQVYRGEFNVHHITAAVPTFTYAALKRATLILIGTVVTAGTNKTALFRNDDASATPASFYMESASHYMAIYELGLSSVRQKISIVPDSAYPLTKGTLISAHTPF